MSPVNIFIAGLIIVTAMTGCTKKQAAEDKDFASTPATTTPAASQDIFDEFYKEDTTTRQDASIEPIKEEPVVRAAETVEFVENGRYVVQVSTVGSRALADEVAAKFSAKGYPSYVAEVQNPTPSLPGTYYRIRIGGFTGISTARSFGENSLVLDGYDYWVDNRSNDNVGLQGGDMGGDTYYTSEETSQPAYQEAEPVAAQPAYNETQPAAAEVYSPEPVSTPVEPVVPAAAVAPAEEYVPAQQYTPESAAQEFDETQSSQEVAPSPESTPAAAPTPAAESNSEWGNEGW